MSSNKKIDVLRNKPSASLVPTEVKMRRPADLGVPTKPIIQAPLIVRRASIDDAGALAEMLGRAYPSEKWWEEGTRLELFQDATIKASLVVELEGRLVATASLQVRSDVPKVGQLRWVATELDWRRRGLARSLIIGLLEIAGKTGCQETRLQTTSDLLGAIALYLQLGFEPLISSDTEGDVWKRVIELLPEV